MKYRVIDWYDGPELLYEGDSAAKAKRARRERYTDTDGEADVSIEELHTYRDEKTLTECSIWVESKL